MFKNYKSSKESIRLVAEKEKNAFRVFSIS